MAMAPLLRVSDLQTHYTSFGGARVVKAVDGISFTLARRRDDRARRRVGLRQDHDLPVDRRAAPCRRRGSSAARIEFNGEDLTKKRPREMRRVRGRQIAMILQDPMASLNPLFSIYWQVAEPAYHHQGMRGRPLRQRVQELLRAVRIASPEVRMREFPHQMSGGMRQRVVGAIAMAGEPRLIIADEPTTNLDVTIQAQYLDVLKDIQQRTGVALIFVTHNLGIVAKMCDKMAVMYAGKIVEQGAVRDLFRAAEAPLYAGIARLDAEARQQRAALRHSRAAAQPCRSCRAGCAFHPRCAHAMPQCAEQEPAERSVAADWTARCWLLDQPAKEAYASAIA